MSSTPVLGLVLVSLLCGCAAAGTTVPLSGSRTYEGQGGPLFADPALLSTAKGGTVVVTPATQAAGNTSVSVSASAPASAAARPEPAANTETVKVQPVSAPVAPVSVAPLAAAIEAPAAPASRPAHITVTPRSVAAPTAPALLRKAEIIPPAAAPAPPAPPTLDIASLKARLRDTSAIGLFSKLALKNQMDDMLEQFRAAYKTGHKTAPAALRQPYDMLVLKVLALLQDGDPALARSVAGSREALWGILADAEKFRTLA